MSENILFKRYVGKELKIFLKNGIKYQGILLEVADNFLVLKDIKVGDMCINTSNISDFKEI